MIALIPARAGSKRLVGKNTKLLAGHPLIAWTIAAAQQSGVFEWILVCADAPEVWEVADRYGAHASWRAPADDAQPDIVWLRDALTHRINWRPMTYAILRPTSPFRTAETIRRAFAQWRRECDCCDSLRAVTPAAHTPYKMWIPQGVGMPMTPLLEGLHPDGTPYHSSPTQTLPVVYVQTGGLEMGWTRNVECFHTISGRKITPFFVDGAEAVDLNTMDDWERAERMIIRGEASLPHIGEDHDHAWARERGTQDTGVSHLERDEKSLLQPKES